MFEKQAEILMQVNAKFSSVKQSEEFTHVTLAHKSLPEIN